jgi:O-antigen/teichoic acid export membrane protein
VSFLSEKLTLLKRDPLLNQVVRSSAHLFTANTLSLAISVLQGPLALRLLGASDFGLVVVVMSYASTVNSLFSFRMAELAVRYGGEYLENGDRRRASALIKGAGLAEAAVSALAFLFILLSAGLASQAFGRAPGAAWMFIVYALGLLANFNTETSTGILQVSGRIRWQGIVNLVQSAATLLVLVAAFFVQAALPVVLLAYLLGKVIIGLGMFLLAQRQLQRLLGPGWWRTPLSVLAPYRELVRFAVSSNISATIIKVFRDSEMLWVAFLLPAAVATTAVAYYKVAYTLVGFLSVPADPLISATYPEINRLVVQKAWGRLRDFLRRITKLALAGNSLIGLGFILLGGWLLSIYGGGAEYALAYPALLILLAGMAFNYTLFWNRPLLLALGLPEFPILVTMLAGLLKVLLAFLLVPRYGYVMEAALLSLYYILSVGAMAWRGRREIAARQAVA